MKNLKTIGLTIVITALLSLIIGLITSNLMIRGAVLGVVLIVTLVVLLKKFRKALLPVILPALIVAIGSLFISTQTLASILVGLLGIAIAAITIFAFIVMIRKGPRAYRPIICVILLTAILTWILPTTYYNYELITDKASQVGLFSLLNYPMISLSYFGNIAIYLLAIGAFYGILHKISAYRNLLDKIAKRAKGREVIILAVIISIIAIFTSVFGASQGIWIVIPFIVSLVLLMGYDRMTAAMVTVAPIAVGLIGNTFAATYVSDPYGSTVQNGMGIVNAILSTSPTTLMIAKAVLLFLGIVIIVVGTLVYASKNKISKKNEEELIPVSSEKKTKIWPLVVVFDLMIVIAMLSLTSWTSVFGLNWFETATEWITSVETFGFAIFGKIFEGVKTFEQWTIDDISTLVVLASIILALIYKVKISDVIDGIISGIKKALKPAAIIILAYVVLVIVNYHPIVLTIIKPLLTSKFNALTMGISAFVSNFFNVDLYYSAQTTLPYITSLITDTSVYPLIALVWQAMYGFVTLVAPTSIVLIAVLSYLNIPYGKWIKTNWMSIVGILVLSFVVIIATVIII